MYKAEIKIQRKGRKCSVTDELMNNGKIERYSIKSKLL